MSSESSLVNETIECPLCLGEGELKRATRALVFEWAAIHQGELRANWELARARLPLLDIVPLD